MSLGFPSWYMRRKFSVAEMLGFAGLALGLFNAVLAQPPFAIGVMPDVEMPIVGLHLGAALCALSLVFTAARRPGDIAGFARHPALIAALLLAGWSALTA